MYVSVSERGSVRWSMPVHPLYQDVCVSRFQSLDDCVTMFLCVCLDVIMSTGISVPTCVVPKSVRFCGSVCSRVPVNVGVLCVG